MSIMSMFLILSFMPILYLSLSSTQDSDRLLSTSLLFAIALFNFSLMFFINFNNSIIGYQFALHLPDLFYISNFFNAYSGIPLFGIDNLSLWFVLLTTFLLPPSILYSINFASDPNIRFYLILLFTLNWILIMFFLTTNALVFYIFFELGLIPVFLLILLWGSNSRNVLAAMYFFVYTFFGSIFFLFALFTLYSITGSLDFIILLNYSYSTTIQLLLWPCLAVALLVNIPMVPLHLWLPEAHVEAPTVGSVYLASLLLNLGSYGFLRLVIPIFPYGTLIYTPAMQTLALISMVYCSATIISQSDLKNIIAYSSIIHMNMSVFALFTFNSAGLQGSILLMFGHGLTSGALFFLVGMLYDRYNTNLLLYYSGLAVVMPLFAFVFLFFSFCNIGFPGTLNFTSELLIFIGVIEYSVLSNTVSFALLVSIALFSSVCYSMWLANNILFGNINVHVSVQQSLTYTDLTESELLVLLPFMFYVILFGLNSTITNLSNTFVNALLSVFM